MYRREYVKPKNVSFSPRVQKANKARQSSNVRHLLCCKVFAGGQHYKTASMRLAGIPEAVRSSLLFTEGRRDSRSRGHDEADPGKTYKYIIIC